MSLFNNFIESYKTDQLFRALTEMIGTIFLVFAYIIIAKAIGIPI